MVKVLNHIINLNLVIGLSPVCMRKRFDIFFHGNTISIDALTYDYTEEQIKDAHDEITLFIENNLK